MKIQVLVATMNQTDHSLIQKMNIQSDAVVINQCNSDSCQSFEYSGYSILWINSSERGLSRSRNLALKNSTADICVICDDDELLSNNYPEMIENAYNNLKDADFVAFNINRIGWSEQERKFEKPLKIGKFKTYSSVHITFKRKSIISHNILFDVRFGTGSGIYASAEDAIFCMDCHKKHLAMYTHPGTLCEVACDSSTWFKGYNSKYFYDIGAYLSVSFPRLKHILKWYYPIRCRKIAEIGSYKIIASINAGFRGFKRLQSYEQYYNK